MKKSGMLVKAAVFSIFMAAAAMLFCGVVLFTLFRNNAMENVKNTLQGNVGVICYQLMSYSSHDWLLNYWKDHADEMERPPSPDGENDQEWIVNYLNYYASYEDLRHINTAEVQTEDVLTMSEEEQRHFAEYCYFEINSDMMELPKMLKLDKVTFFEPEKEAKKGYVFFYFDRDEILLGGQTWRLGTEIPFDINQRPELQRLYDEELFYSEEEIYRSEEDGEEYASTYMLFRLNSGKELITEVTISLNKIMKDVWADVIHFEAWIACVILVTIIFVLLNIYFGGIRPTVRLQKVIEEYTGNWDSRELKEKLNKHRPNNELGSLSDNLVRMGEEIDLHVNEVKSVTAEKERIGAELDVASRIQTGVLPKDFGDASEKANCILYASMTPAKEVGGDLYDFFMVDEDHLALVIGDVSGKGIPAALFMITTKALIKSALKQGEKSPSAVLSGVGDLLSEGNEEWMFVTVWIGILELSSGKMICSNAGHELPVIYRKNGDFTFFRDEHGVPVATMEGAEYEDYELEIHSGDTLFVYSDGLPEAQNKADEMFGEERLLTALNEEPGGMPEELIERMSKRVTDFVGDCDPFDDLTMLCIKLR